MTSEPRGAGRGGGLLFLVILAFVAYLAIGALAGVVRFLLGVALVVLLAAFALSVVRRR